jgi:hypothetical protein
MYNMIKENFFNAPNKIKAMLKLYPLKTMLIIFIINKRIVSIIINLLYLNSCFLMNFFSNNFIIKRIVQIYKEYSKIVCNLFFY